MLCLKSILCQTYLNKVITCNRLDDCQKSHAFELSTSCLGHNIALNVMSSLVCFFVQSKRK